MTFLKAETEKWVTEEKALNSEWIEASLWRENNKAPATMDVAEYTKRAEDLESKKATTEIRYKKEFVQDVLGEFSNLKK